ncbi:MAG: hypothetical protein QXV09_04130, partial [Candidatus Bathyarchaeia archaeon]
PNAESFNHFPYQLFFDPAKMKKCMVNPFHQKSLKMVSGLFTLDLKVDLHSGHLKRPTRNSGITPYSACLAGETVQHLTAVVTVVPQFGQLTTVYTPLA